jgi:hypothetical protein
MPSGKIDIHVRSEREMDITFTEKDKDPITFRITKREARTLMEKLHQAIELQKAMAEPPVKVEDYVHRNEPAEPGPFVNKKEP